MKADKYEIEFVESPVYAALAAEMHAQCFFSPWDKDSFKSAMANPGTVYGLLTTNNTPMAFALFRIMGIEAEILTFGVLPQFQGQGYGTKLLRNVFEELNSKGACEIFLEVSEENKSALKLYQSNGFSEFGRRNGYYNYEGKRHDAILMKRAIQPAMSKNSGTSD